ncbi:MAG: hypothetical protein ACI9VS_001816 [Candidatus Binatia bacterium]|jgi:hypothetical protein
MSINPRRLVPYHGIDPFRLQPYPGETTHPEEATADEVQDPLPRIPVLEVPADLECAPGRLASKFGDYILYNGHHRRFAALRARAPLVPIMVLQTDEDLKQLEPSERLCVPSDLIADHRERVFAQVRERALATVDEETRLLAAIRLSASLVGRRTPRAPASNRH